MTMSATANDGKVEFNEQQTHRCTVVGNSGGSLGFWPNSFEGGTWGLSENLGGSPFSCFIASLCDNFSEPLPSLCTSMQRPLLWPRTDVTLFSI